MDAVRGEEGEGDSTGVLTGVDGAERAREDTSSRVDGGAALDAVAVASGVEDDGEDGEAMTMVGAIVTVASVTVVKSAGACLRISPRTVR
jgi:hypothetical protein